MKKALLICGVLVAFAAPAMAGGLNFAWGLGCWPENPVSNAAFACNTNGGSDAATGSFTVSNNQPEFVGIEAVIDLQAASPTLPAWWQFFNPGSCRQSSLSASADFLGSPNTSCTDPWTGLGAGGIAAYQTIATSPAVPNGLPNAARIKIAFALADPSPLTAGTEYYGLRIVINHAKTVGTGACAGCSTPVCLALNSIKSAQRTGPSELVSAPLANQTLSYQNALSCLATPASNHTWGQIKSLYR